MRRWLALAPLLLVALIVVASGFILLRDKEQPHLSTGELGRAAPSFALPSLFADELVTSDAFAGRAHLVNFYASWCTPCRAEHPVLMDLRGRGVMVLGVAYKDSPEASRRFLAELGDPFEVVAVDADGRFALEMGVAGAVPETFVIDAEGRIREVYRGPLTRDAVEQVILPALDR